MSTGRTGGCVDASRGRVSVSSGSAAFTSDTAAASTSFPPTAPPTTFGGKSRTVSMLTATTMATAITPAATSTGTEGLKGNELWGSVKMLKSQAKREGRTPVARD